MTKIAAGTSSTTYVDANEPRMLLIHGTADKVVLGQQSEQMAATLKKAGTPVDPILTRALIIA